MRALILGGDGYLGWATAMAFAARGHDVLAVDNALRRRLCEEIGVRPLFPMPPLTKRADIFFAHSGKRVAVCEGDLRDAAFVDALFRDFEPEAAIHYAEQPSAPYSVMGPKEARLTLDNNLGVTHNVILSVLARAPRCHIIKLGTMGEYGTPNIDIEEGWIEIEHKGRKDSFLFPRQAGSLYHTTKVMDTDLLWFYVRAYSLRVTDLMQGPVYGISTDESDLDERLSPCFNYDDVFGTVVNRFLTQAAAGEPLTVYGKGGQTRGYLNIRDTINCVELAMQNPVAPGELRILNQFTETFSVNDLARIVRKAGRAMGLSVKVESIENPRRELEEHHYNPAHSGLLELGLKPHFLTQSVAEGMLEKILGRREAIDRSAFKPRVKWSRETFLKR